MTSWSHTYKKKKMSGTGVGNSIKENHQYRQIDEEGTENGL